MFFSQSNTVTPPPLHTRLVGNNAFYKHYQETDVEFGPFPDQVDYTVNLDNRVYRFAKTLFDYTIGLPITIMHGLIGATLLQASPATRISNAINPNNLLEQRKNTVETFRSVGIEVKRVTLNIDGYKVDAQIYGHKKILNNGKWTVFAGGNAMLCNESPPNIATFLEESENNLITFNFPSVGSSPGILPSKEACVKAVQGVVHMLEDDVNGLGAKEITLWGLSFGGGVMGEALSSHTPKQGVKYVVIKDRTFSEIADTAWELGHKIAPFFQLPTVIENALINIYWIVAKLFGWNLNASKSIDKFNAPEIILQQANQTALQKKPQGNSTFIMTASDELSENDDIISKETSLAKRVFSDVFDGKRDKVTVIGLKEGHNALLSDGTQREIVDLVKAEFAK